MTFMCIQRWLFSKLGLIGAGTGALFAAVLLTACSTLPNPAAEDLKEIEKGQVKLLGDMPLPRGARIDSDNSLILGSGEGWAGRVALVAAQGPTETFAFFRDQYPPAGWTMVSSTQSKNSILVFVKNDRTATIEISAGSLLGAKASVLMTVSPRSTVIPAQKAK